MALKEKPLKKAPKRTAWLMAGNADRPGVIN
jgi:hypothetical protein